MGHAELEPEDIDETISPLYGAIKRTWNDFCATTSIHGLKFTRDPETNGVVRFIWILITLIMFVCAIVMVFTFYVDYSSNPTRMNIETDYAPVSNLYFPGITICPADWYNMQKSKEYIGTLKLPEGVQTDHVIDALRVSYGFQTDDEHFEDRDVELLESVLELNNILFMDFIHKLRWNCVDVIFRCRYQRVIVPCDKLFQVTRSFHGYCCSFNIIQTGVNFTAKLSRSGLIEGLSLILYYNDTMVSLTRSYSSGFHLLIHENAEYPAAHSVAKFVPLNEEVFVSVQPEELFCSTAVRKLPWQERLCVLADEFKLRHFREVRKGHCQLNCRAINMINYCGCLTHFFHNNLTSDRVCTFRDVPCLVANFTEIIGRFRGTQCNCKRLCEETDYDVQSTSADLRLDAPTVDTFYDGIKKNYAVVHVFLKSQVYRRVRRDLLSNMVTLVSNLGSAFSLFVGMSMVSAVEIIYYFTVILRKYYLQEAKARAKLLFNKVSRVQVLKEE